MRRILVLYAALVALLAASLATSLRRGRVEEPPIPSTWSNSTAGMRALYLFLEEAGFRVRRHALPLTELDDEATGSLLVLASPAHRPIDAREAGRIKTWVGAGNTLVFLSGAGDPFRLQEPDDTEDELRATLDLEIERPAGDAPREKGEFFLPNRVPCPETEGIDSLCAGDSLETSVRAPGAVPFYGVEGERAVYRMPVGRGYVYVFPSTRYFSNGAVAKGDNLALFVNLADLRVERGEVLFDEGHHGLARGSSGALWRTRGARAGGAVLVLLLAAGIWSRGRRFGEPIPLRRDSRRRGVEYVQALANLFRKGRKAEYILASLAASFRRRACAFAGLPPGARDDAIESAMEAALPREAASVRFLLRAAGDSAPGVRVSERLLVRWARTARDVEESMRRWRAS